MRWETFWQFFPSHSHPCRSILVREFFTNLNILFFYLTSETWIDGSEANNNRAHKFFPSSYSSLSHIRPGATEIWVCARYFRDFFTHIAHVMSCDRIYVYFIYKLFSFFILISYFLFLGNLRWVLSWTIFLLTYCDVW